MDYFERIAEEWRERAPELAAWSMRCLVNRTDVWGRYLDKKHNPSNSEMPAQAGQQSESVELKQAITAPFRDERGKVFLNESSLIKHFRTRKSGGILGVHSAAADLSSRWLAIDIDLHDADELSVSAEGNFVAARHWFQALLAQGFDPILMDSNGCGGFHLLTLFAVPLTTRSVHEFGTRLVSDFALRGLDQRPEIFPGGPRFDHYGDWLRLPGRHHTHDHYTRVYDEEDWGDDPWLSGHDAIDRLLTMRVADLSICQAAGMEAQRRTICLDFDGVLHSYRSGWQGAESIPDPPIHGTDKALMRLRQEYRVVIHSARCATQAGRTAIQQWLDKHGILVDEICEHKPPAMLYIDDRGIRFEGNWSETMSRINEFRK